MDAANGFIDIIWIPSRTPIPFTNWTVLRPHPVHLPRVGGGMY